MDYRVSLVDVLYSLIGIYDAFLLHKATKGSRSEKHNILPIYSTYYF